MNRNACATGVLILAAGLSGILVAGFGCSKQDAAKPAASKSESSSASSGGNPLTAPVDYLSTVAKAQKSATKSLTATGLDQAVKLFYAQEGRFPKDLKELVPGYLGSIPPAPQGMKYSYEADSGTVKIVPQ